MYPFNLPYPCAYYAQLPIYNTLPPYMAPYCFPFYYPNAIRPMLRSSHYPVAPLIVDIQEATLQNENYRTTLWTGDHLQVTLMSIPVGSDIGLEVHPMVDQFIRIEQGEGLVQMGPSEDQLDLVEPVSDDYAIMIPAGTWHNVTNTGEEPLKLYAIYAPPEHPAGTIHKTKADALADEMDKNI